MRLGPVVYLAEDGSVAMKGVANAKLGIDTDAPLYVMPLRDEPTPFVVAIPPPPPPEPIVRTCAEEVVWMVNEDGVERRVWGVACGTEPLAIGTATAVRRSEGDCTIGGVAVALDCVPYVTCEVVYRCSAPKVSTSR